MSGVFPPNQPWLSVEARGVFSDPRNPLPIAFLGLLRQQSMVCETCSDVSAYALAWKAAGGNVQEDSLATVCSASVRLGGIAVQLQCVWQAAAGFGKTVCGIDHVPVLCTAFDANLGECAVVAATQWDNGMAALCAEDGVRQAGLNCSVREDEPQRSVQNPLGAYRTRPGAAAHIIFGTVSPDLVQKAVAAACGYVERRLDIVRADMAQGEEKALCELHYPEK